MAEIFRRVEKKYILTKNQHDKVLQLVSDHLVQDQYGKSTICNIYFDSDNYDLISHSITKPYFKDKVRLRSYNTPNKDSKVYLEIKRKYDGVVGKRRIEMTLADFHKYLDGKDPLGNSNKQIKSELDYYFNYYTLKPAMYISYSREAFYEKNNPDFRLTFDSEIHAREYDLDLTKGNYGKDVLGKDKYIMEVKTLGAMPMWFVDILEQCSIVPGSFSKYGEAYTQIILMSQLENLRALSRNVNLKQQTHGVKSYKYAECIA